MVDDRPEDTGSLPDSGRPKREPPTIDLDATEVSSETKSAPETSSEAPPEPSSEPAPEAPSVSPADAPAPRPVSPWVVAPVSGAVAAALVIGVGWMLGWPAVQPASAPSAPQLSAAIDGLTARVAGLEPKVGKPVPDPAVAARTEALEKSIAALRAELAATRAQGEKLASAINDVKSAPRGDERRERKQPPNPLFQPWAQRGPGSDWGPESIGDGMRLVKAATIRNCRRARSPGAGVAPRTGSKAGTK